MPFFCSQIANHLVNTSNQDQSLFCKLLLSENKMRRVGQLIVVIISQSIPMPNHHVVHFKYMQFYLSIIPKYSRGEVRKWWIIMIIYIFKKHGSREWNKTQRKTDEASKAFWKYKWERFKCSTKKSFVQEKISIKKRHACTGVCMSHMPYRKNI